MRDSNLKIDIRRKKILDILFKNGKVYIAELENELAVSAVTLRNDLSVLEKEGKLERISGGATLPQNVLSGVKIPHYRKKTVIASAAAEFIKSGDTLFVNSGSTALLAATLLCEKQNLNVVTNSLDAARIMGAQPSIRVILLGGEINSQYGFTHGGDAQEQLNRFSADWAILSVDGISADGEITTYHAEEAIIDRIMMERAKRVLIVADSSKIGKIGFSFVESCSDKTQIITNASGKKATLDPKINIKYI